MTRTIETRARRLTLSGRVQGVGFRPFVYRLAQGKGLTGWVLNSSGRVVIHVEGDETALAAFARALIAEAPPLARPVIETSEAAAVEGHEDFAIHYSAAAGEADVHVPPDLFCCDDCLAELNDPTARRYRYPFTNCTQCGPRYTLIAALPYDRPNTSMAAFALCADCRAEYENPGDRRFHAQPLACSICGPQVSFEQGDVQCHGEAALTAAIAVLKRGGIVAAKGVGGFHLLCDAADDAAVQTLRARKHRPDKPLAVMIAGGVESIAVPDPVAAQALADPLRPIVLVRKKAGARLSEAVAPGLDEIGVFLPYSPLHHLLLAGFGGPLVATSGNISGEPVITDEAEARRRLAHIADALLTHNRPILRPADDSVIRVIAGAPRVIRVGRGLAPLERDLAQALPQPTLATGGQMKGAIALGWGLRAVVSPHIGELDTARGQEVFAQVIGDLTRLYQVTPQLIACDLHRGYSATRWALAQGTRVRAVQHHVAHASGLAGEYPEVHRWLTFTWDGVGLGDDGGLWGGETFLGKPGAWQRAASFRPFHLVGGDKAAREPWRCAAALLWEEGRDMPGHELAHQAWQKRLGTHRSSAVGRLFDAAAALVLGIEMASFEGQGPMQLEAIADSSDDAIDIPMRGDRADWAPLLAMLADQAVSPVRRAAIFHESLAALIVQQAKTFSGFDAVGLTGGVFQNKRLAEAALRRLERAGFRALLPQSIPANDGGLAFGQLIEVSHGGGVAMT